MFDFLCKDLYPTVFSFLLYTESISLQQCSKYSLKQKEQMEKYCQHTQPHGKIEMYHRETKLIIKEENYYEGKKDGIQICRHKDGQLFIKESYTNGKQNGMQEGWNSDGTFCYKQNYHNGKIKGYQSLGRWIIVSELI